MTLRARIPLLAVTRLGIPAALLSTLCLLAASAGADAPIDRLAGGRIGVQVQPMTPELRQHFGAPPDRGLLVVRVEADRPAARAGLAVGDVILEADGEAQRRTWDLVRVVGRAPEGRTLPLRVLRSGRTRIVEVVPSGAPMPWPDPGELGEWLDRGMQMGSRELRRQLRALERRLEQLEQKIEQEPEDRDGAERT